MTLPDGTPGGDRQESRWRTMVVSLRYPDFRLVWIGSLSEHFGEMMRRMTILWLVNEMTRSPLMLTIVGSVEGLALLVFPIVGGVVADRVNRRILLMTTLAVIASLAIILAVLVATGTIAIWHLIVIALLHGVATSFNHPARAGIVPNLVKREHLLNAIVLDTFSVQGLRVVAGPIVGYLIVSLGMAPIFVIVVVCAVIPIVLLSFVKTPFPPLAVKGETFRQNLTVGFRYLRNNTIVLVMLLLYFIPMVQMNTVGTLMPVVADKILNVGALEYGFLQGASGLGAALSLIALAMLTYYKSKHKLFVGAAIILGIALLGFSGSQWFWLSLPLLVVIGSMNSSFQAIITTLVQGFIPDEMRGRVMSWREVARGFSPAVVIAFGFIAQQAGVPFAYGLLGGSILLISLVLFVLLPRFRSLEEKIVV